jgi:hypothetical protein
VCILTLSVLSTLVFRTPSQTDNWLLLNARGFLLYSIVPIFSILARLAQEGSRSRPRKHSRGKATASIVSTCFLKHELATTSLFLPLLVQFCTVYIHAKSTSLVSTSSLLSNDAPLLLRRNPCDAPPSKLTWPLTRLMHPAHQSPATPAPLCNAMSNHGLVMHRG